MFESPPAVPCRQRDGGAVADGLKDLLEASGAWGADRAVDDDAHVDQDGVRGECGQVVPLGRVARLEDDDCWPKRQRRRDGLRVTSRRNRGLDPNLGSEVLRDSLAQQCMLVKDDDRVLRCIRHGLPPPERA